MYRQGSKRVMNYGEHSASVPAILSTRSQTDPLVSLEQETPVSFPLVSCVAGPWSNIFGQDIQSCALCSTRD